MNTLISIVGPTAVGKTSLAIQVAKHFQTEIISADSRQFYKEMHIGTAKPDLEEQQGIPHHFIHSHSLHEGLSAGDFEVQGLACLKEIFSRHKRAVLVGGSGLFVNALLEGLDDLPKPKEGVRERLNLLFKTKGLAAIQQLLKEKDADYYEQVDQSNPQRMIRALEVVESTGIPFSQWRKNTKKKRDFEVISIGLTLERELLYSRINKRVDLMMQAGLLEEVKSLMPFKESPTLQTVGYAELFAYLAGQISLEQAVAKIKQNSRKYAKRQLTWFNRNPKTRWFSPNQIEEILSYIEGYRTL